MRVNRCYWSVDPRTQLYLHLYFQPSSIYAIVPVTNPFKMSDPVDKLVVNIALLKLTTEFPESPSEQCLRHGHTTGRTISLKDERSISHQLAFICAYSDNKGHVMGACIEENPRNQSLVIRFASNSGQHENVTATLKDIASILQTEAIKGTSQANYNSSAPLIV
jgi:hypothetical protein